jgi:phosphotriesterase-related protein
VGDQQVRILEEEGVDLHRVYIGHSNDDTDLGYLLGLLEKGVWLGMDRYPGGRLPGTPDWEQRTAVVKQLMDAGYSHRLMLSHDYSVPKARHGTAVQEARRRANPDGYTFISRRVLPRLKELAPQTTTSTRSRWRTRVGSLKGADLPPVDRGPRVVWQTLMRVRSGW